MTMIFNRYNYRFLLCCLSMMLWLGTPMADAKDDEPDIYSLSLDENLEQPEIKKKKWAELISKYQYDLAVQLTKQGAKGYDVELMRDNEVIVVTIPAANLFMPNDTVVTRLGNQLLRDFVPFLKNPGFYKMLLVMHSDNTGSQAYTLQMTRSRVNAIFDWFEEHVDTDFVVPYALGDTDPIVANNSIENRSRNRRLEIYIVPEKVMLDQAKNGKVNMNVVYKYKRRAD